MKETSQNKNEIPQQLKDAEFCLVHENSKKPIGNSWQLRGLKSTDPTLLTHVNKGGNVGALHGKKMASGKTLVVLEADCKEMAELVRKRFPETFRTSSGSAKQGEASWFVCDTIIQTKSVKLNGKHAGEIRGASRDGTPMQTLIPPSKHPSGTHYTTTDNKPIAEITEEQLQAGTADLREEKRTVEEILADPDASHEEKNSCVMSIFEYNYQKITAEQIAERIMKEAKWHSDKHPLNYERTLQEVKRILTTYSNKPNPNREPTISKRADTTPTTKIQQLRTTFNNWLLMKKDLLVDLCCAVAINHLTQSETSLWFFVVGASGISKTEVVRSFIDPENKNIKCIRRLTKNTLVSGNPKVSDLAPALKGKLLITTDVAIFLKLDPHEKGLVWAQLRDLYDGYAGRQTGSGVDKDYSGIQPIAWLFCSTPMIDEELLLHQVLGTRELVFRVPNEWFNEEEVMERIWQNKEQKTRMREELTKATRQFLSQFEKLQKIKISPEAKKKINELAKLTTLLRAGAQVDGYTGELETFVNKEAPTRVLEQFIELYCCLMNLDKEYPEDRALEILTHVCVSSVHPTRIRVFEEVLSGEKTSSQIKRNLGLGYKTVIRELQILKGLDIAEEIEEKGEEPYYKSSYNWRLKDTPNSRLLRKFLEDRQASLAEWTQTNGGVNE